MKTNSFNSLTLWIDAFLEIIAVSLTLFGAFTVCFGSPPRTAGWIALIGGAAFALTMLPSFFKPPEIK